MRSSNRAWLLTAAAAFTLFACNPDDPTKLIGGAAPVKDKPVCPDNSGPTGNNPTTTSGGDPATTGGSTMSTASGATPGEPTVLDERVLSYTEALRTASLKIVGNVPTLEQIETVRAAEDPKKAYEDLVDELMKSPAFSSSMVRFWQNTFRMGGAAAQNVPNRDGAPNFAAQIVVEGRDYRDLFTAAAGTCPTLDTATGMFTAADCLNGPVTAGILTDAGLHYQYASALAFRRVRFIQETFACHKLPAEYSATPVPKGNGTYTSPWPFDSIGDTSNGGRVGFQDTTSAICANCHTTMNHRAPLLAAFDDFGQYVEPVPDPMDNILTYSAIVPIEGTPKVKFSDYLVPGETPAWKFGKPAPTMKEFGEHMAADDEVLRCGVVRAWNYAFSKGDAVYDLADIPDSVIGPLVNDFKANGFKLRDTLRAIFVHDDFVRF